MVSDIHIIKIICSFYILIGYFGNISTIIIFRQKEFQKQSTSFYFICACIVNLVIITYLPWALMPDLWTLSSFSCKIFLEIYIGLVEIQSWILAVCSFDRVFMVMASHKFLFRKKLKFQLATVIIISIILIVALIPYLYYFNLEQTIQNTTLCLLSPETPSWVWIYGKLDFFLFRAVVPFSIMIISSVFIFWKVYNRKKKLRGVDASFQQEYQMAICLVLVDISFLFLRLPNSIYTIIYKKDDGSIIYTNLCSIFSLLANGHCVFDFIIFICCNKIYRNLFSKTILCCRNKNAAEVGLSTYKLFAQIFQPSIIQT